MRFSYDGADLYGFSMIGQKIESMRLIPAVCVEFDERTSPYEWTSVIATGVYEELPDLPQYQSARLHAQTVLQRLASWWQPALAAGAHDKGFEPVFFRIRISALSGHQASPEPAESVSLRGRHSATPRVGAIRRLLSGFLRSKG
jgi:nitroimidazol reductase NimA-like FMN-containing flavoprotein (pyridoxamine 5'-phosphate oxidase superfamily)